MRLRGIFVRYMPAYRVRIHAFASKTERLWFSHLLESDTPDVHERSLAEKSRIHALLARSETFDQFLQLKFPNLKRYGLEGGESMLPALDALFAASREVRVHNEFQIMTVGSQTRAAGIENIVLGMPHRGRLNLLTGLLEYSPAALFHKIKVTLWRPDLQYGGASKPVKVTLLPNPSHLEAVNPVVLGKTRAKQFSLLKTLLREGEIDCRPGDKVLCVQLHGDASLTGQGVIMEGLSLSNLPHYTVGGSVHIVVNIGYTTPASSARSSLYCSDIAKMINAPVLHVNGDYPEDVARAVEIAFKYRNYFRKDIIIDLIVYRRWGHNELDEPAFTQPLMYEKIRSRRSVPSLYEEQLINEEVLTSGSAEGIRAEHKAFLTSELAAADSHIPGSNMSMLQSQWQGLVWPASEDAIRTPETGIAHDVLLKVGKASVTVPEVRTSSTASSRSMPDRDWTGLQQRRWRSAPSCSMAVTCGYQDKMSVGERSVSGHAMLVDQTTEGVVVPLNAALDCDGRLELANSSLSEMAVLGFEYGFGDFFNGAQVIIDTFISSAETKWLKQSGIVLLPHGLDGAGPEHSSSRLERMLQLTNDRYVFDESSSANVNMHVVFPTTPAQYFHLLRRQIKRNYRKPLIVAGPKALLRLPAASSSLSDLEPGSHFHPVLDDPGIDKSRVKRIVCLSGKLYYDLIKERQKRQLDNLAFVRIEELCPFPFEGLLRVLTQYGNAGEIIWLQEEPRNQGAVEEFLIKGGKKMLFLLQEFPGCTRHSRKLSLRPPSNEFEILLCTKRACNIKFRRFI
ncbi:putative 2-oxoglutarate dehydrogenase E1 component DHKTD1, mitochondrial [Grifola frondosa]|uniref:Putative 2-oxoglutarate dehydrogenase E1 component DHKTD1, mitochondrial n=1 Tax=Grifola frondosa TaxID=5627 RepID=A0A1C7LSX0_GRIFR|nr:putative 2-oxoglutarate dehydrogenase E1 component DHKTD1, mitochondrial [Grifola frondosa]